MLAEVQTMKLLSKVTLHILAKWNLVLTLLLLVGVEASLMEGNIYKKRSGCGLHNMRVGSKGIISHTYWINHENTILG